MFLSLNSEAENGQLDHALQAKVPCLASAGGGIASRATRGGMDGSSAALWVPLPWPRQGVWEAMESCTFPWSFLQFSFSSQPRVHRKEAGWPHGMGRGAPPRAKVGSAQGCQGDTRVSLLAWSPGTGGHTACVLCVWCSCGPQGERWMARGPALRCISPRVLVDWLCQVQAGCGTQCVSASDSELLPGASLSGL